MSPNFPGETQAGSPAGTGTIKIFGVGAAGLNLLDQLIIAGLPGAEFIALDADPAALAACHAAEKIQLETRLLRGLGTGGDPDRARVAAEEQSAKLKERCEGAKTVILLAGLGGGAGTGISPVVACVARDAGALVLASVVLPFECEGNLRLQTAQAGLGRLQEVADLVLCLPNQKAMALIDEATCLTDSFRASNQLLGASLRGACEALAGDTVMGLPFADLCTLIRQRSADCAFAVASASGANRASEVIERLATHPLLEAVESTKSEAVAVCVVGGPSLGMVEVNRIMDQIHKQYEGVPVMMGAVIAPHLADTLLLGLLVARPEAPETAAPRGVQPPARCGVRETPLEADTQFLSPAITPRPHSRFVAPAPPVTPERLQQLQERNRSATRSRKPLPKLRQTQLPLEIISKGRFDQSEPTIHKGEDLDVPTYIRRGVPLN